MLTILEGMFVDITSAEFIIYFVLSVLLLLHNFYFISILCLYTVQIFE